MLTDRSAFVSTVAVCREEPDWMTGEGALLPALEHGGGGNGVRCPVIMIVNGPLYLATSRLSRRRSRHAVL